MRLKKIGSKSFVVNLLSDFIISKIPHNESSIVKIVDCGNFFVIKGKTTSKEILFIPDIISEFNKKFSLGSELTHTIDLIEYDAELSEVRKITHTFHNNTSNCSYHYKDVDDYENMVEENDMIYVSSFPHGYSLNQGRLLYYYGKKIFYNIPSNYPITSLKLKLSMDKNSDGEFDIQVFDEFYKSEDETLRSAILDVFDFNMESIEKEVKKVDWSVELTDPLSEYDFLKEKVEGFIII